MTLALKTCQPRHLELVERLSKVGFIQKEFNFRVAPPSTRLCVAATAEQGRLRLTA